MPILRAQHPQAQLVFINDGKKDTQVNGHNAIFWDEKFALDVWYDDNRSLWLDQRIIWLTIRKVVKRDGTDDAGGVGQEKFKGNRT